MSEQNGNGVNGVGVGSNLLSRTVAYALTLHSIGTSRKVATGLISTDAKADRIHVSKRILECEEIQDIQSIDSRLRLFVARRAVPYPLKSGIHLIPTALVEEVDAEVERRKPERAAIVERFAEKVEELRERDRTALGSLFSDGDYPTADQIRDAYSIETRYIALDLPSNLRSVSKDVFDRERARIAREMADAADLVRQVQRAQLVDLVNDIVEKLTPDADGKAKRLKRGCAVDQMAEFLGRYGALNVTDDAELSAIVEKARAVLAGVDLETLRSNDTMVAAVKAGMQKIGAALEPLIEITPRRRFREIA